MDIWGKYKSPFGYQVGDNGIDSYGVDHSGFTFRDEIEYQTARDNRESQMMQMYNQQGITDNYPQYTTNFWGDSANNYGFGSSDISSNIANVINQLDNNEFKEPMLPLGAQKQPQDYSLIKNIKSLQSDDKRQISSILQPSSYVNEQQAYTTDYTNNYPNISDATNYNQMYRNYLHPQNNENTTKSIDYSLYGDGFSKEFIDKMLGDQRFQQIMRNRTQRNEGDFSNHPNDRGGKTMYGISSKWYPNEDIPNLTRERANALLYRDYWLDTCINQLPDEFAGIVFDNSVVQGQPTAITNLQKALGIQADGIIGPNTLNAISNADGSIRKKFIQQVHQRNQNIVKQDPKQRIFLNGWTNRANNY